ncbi:MAG: hypothetical protein HFJ75_06740, partial [Eggerthellaceae bacterium]|nr:hypothetical protein [Eggerthellaceae bacterium]
MIDTSVFHTLSYGLYLITSRQGDRKVGCVANTFQQVTSSPFRVSVALNKDNATTAAILETGRFCCTVLGQDATMDLIGAFGFRTSTEFDKFAACDHGCDGEGVPYVTDCGVAWFSVKVGQTLDVGTHILFVGDVEDAQRLSDAAPMTYDYYHTVLRGKTPPKASAYVPDAPAAAVPSPAVGDGDGSAIAADEGGVRGPVLAAAGAAPYESAVHEREDLLGKLQDDESALATDLAEAQAQEMADAPAEQLAVDMGVFAPGMEEVVAEEAWAEESAAAEAALWGWQCTVCGHIVEGYPDGLPEDFTCPICGVGREM